MDQSRREFVDENREKTDPDTGKRYPVRMILRVAEYSSAAYYGHLRHRQAQKRGPKTSLSDEDLALEIKATMDAIPFHGTGYKKIHGRMSRNLKKKGHSVSKNRVMRIMKERNMLNKPSGGTGSSREHDGTLITDAPNVMWGTDGKKFFTRRDGWCWLFDVIDHFNSEVIGYNVVKYGDRYEATRAVQNAVVHRFGAIEKGIAQGIVMRNDRGSQYISDFYRNSMTHLGIELSYTWARSPESNGVIERFHRTIEEQVFRMYDFETIEEAEKVIREFIDLYNREWMLERLGYLSPNEALCAYDSAVQKSA
ncbi:IS3 family transposase [Vibrio sp.]|uniref:IS3 family transposase n=1 Tax=Vibrio sp. TaxID=678 RepID=UPI003D138D4A